MSTLSGNSNNDNSYKIFQLTQPVLTKEYDYSNWKQNLSIWEALTSLEKEKQGVEVFLSLTSQDNLTERAISGKFYLQLIV